jgi:hypothetical protein
LLLLLAAACAGSESGSPAANAASGPNPSQSARSIPTVAIRLSRSGGPLLAYMLPQLTAAGWAIGGRTSPGRAAIGMDVPGRRLLYRDSAGAIQSFDLVAYRERPVAPRGAFEAMASDGTLLAVSAQGKVTESEPWGSREWPGSVGRGVREAFAGLGSRLIVLRRARGDSLSVASREAGVALTTPVPDATARAASRDGDAVAFATDSGLVVAEDRDLQSPWFIRLRGGPVAVAFTPSGHRIYVGLKNRSVLEVVDRYRHRTLRAVALPGAAGALRMDPWGRAVLVRPGAEQGASDAVWVVSIATDQLVGQLDAGWASDLPTVSEGGVLLVRQGRAVVARDVHTLDPLGAVRQGAPDLWFVGRWKPAIPTPVAGPQVLAAQPRPAAAAAPVRPSPGAGPTPGPAAAAPADRIWVQVSVSQNERWARDLANELVRSGYRARVVAPQTLGAGWRVVVGPYATRVVAESAARTLGRPYWIVERGADSVAGP